jgi:long-subunit fatty acid transport protein
MKKIIFTFATLLATLGAAHAQTYAPAAAPKPVRFLLGMGLSGGGDELASAHYTNGETVNIHAGGLIYLTAGVDYHFTPEFSLQATVNYHVDRANARNGNVKFERVPVELIGYYQPNPSWRVGGGVRYINSPKLSGSGAGSGLDADFDNTTSAVIEGEYFTSPNLGIKLRYVNETFKSRAYKDVDGSHIGLSANFYF